MFWLSLFLFSWQIVTSANLSYFIFRTTFGNFILYFKRNGIMKVSAIIFKAFASLFSISLISQHLQRVAPRKIIIYWKHSLLKSFFFLRSKFTQIFQQSYFYKTWILRTKFGTGMEETKFNLFSNGHTNATNQYSELTNNCQTKKTVGTYILTTINVTLHPSKSKQKP